MIEPIITDDTVKDFRAYDRQREEELRKLHVCSCCREPIQQPDAFCVNGEYWCDACMEDMRVDLMGGIWG